MIENVPWHIQVQGKGAVRRARVLHVVEVEKPTSFGRFAVRWTLGPGVRRDGQTADETLPSHPFDVSASRRNTALSLFACKLGVNVFKMLFQLVWGTEIEQRALRSHLVTARWVGSKPKPVACTSSGSVVRQHVAIPIGEGGEADIWLMTLLPQTNIRSSGIVGVEGPNGVFLF